MSKKKQINTVTGEVTIVDTPADELYTPTAEENWASLRFQRDFKLNTTDRWALSDRSMTAAQIKYRQDLRDLPANTSDPANPIWPSKP